MPITRPYLVSMAAYNSWMNGKVYDAAARLPPEEIARDRGAFFKSILGTLNHLLYADLVWIGRFKDGRPRITDPDVLLLHEDLSALRQARRALDREIEDWAKTIDETWLARPFTFKTLKGDAEFTFPASILVMHMFNHQTHHRGQITTLLTQAGEDVGVTDILMLPGLKEMV
ncbi:DinB family protein [Taklimakanibacter deserti]|uniref:DinB family protein n=1 Tax=Taklimakanibacter deserti TaxID=2267839 RepID=UPI0034D70839